MTEPTPKKNKPNLTNTALSILEKEDGWYIVKIRFNSVGNVGAMELIKQDGKMEAIYNYKIMAANEVLPE